MVKRGDIYFADLSPVVGSEQGGMRPVLIIQNDAGNRHSPTVIAAAITSKTGKAPLPTHISVAAAGGCGLTRDSIILLEQIRTIDKLINGEFPEELKDLFAGEGGLFPNPAEISFLCSCPDWALMCKHVAAVMYGIGVRFDENPFFFFHLRGIDIDRFIDVTLEKKVESMLQNADVDSPRILHETTDLTELFGVL